MTARESRLAILIEALSRYARPRPRPLLGQYRRYGEARIELDLRQRYYLARGSRGDTLIPHDDFLEEVETILSLCTSDSQ